MVASNSTNLTGQILAKSCMRGKVTVSYDKDSIIQRYTEKRNKRKKTNSVVTRENFFVTITIAVDVVLEWK